MTNQVTAIVLPVTLFPAAKAPQEETTLQKAMRELAINADGDKLAPSELELVRRELALLCSRFDGEVG